MRRWISTFIILMTVCHHCSGEQLKSTIQQRYRKAAYAASLKFVDGMLYARSPDYEAFGLTGRRMDLTLERERFRKLFAAALRVRLKAEIVESKNKGPDTLVCLVKTLFYLERMDSELGPRVTLIETHSVDEWRHINGEWLLAATRILQQTSQERAGLLDREEAKPVKFPK